LFFASSAVLSANIRVCEYLVSFLWHESKSLIFDEIIALNLTQKRPLLPNLPIDDVR